MKLISIITLALSALSFAGCATMSTVTTAPFIYHELKKGQTLWALSHIYGAPLEEITRINQIRDASNLETGQLIMIPRTQKEQPAASGTGMTNEEFIWPVKGKILATFGQIFDNMINKGLDIQPRDGALVFASRSGKVVFQNNNLRGFGKTIIIDHGDGFLTVYARNSEIMVNPGDYIQKGSPIAKIKNTYLHFEIRKGHIAQNPEFYLAG